MTRPIVIVGCGRSGTTLFYRMLCCHPDLGWFSNVTDRWPRLPALAYASNLFPLVTRMSLGRRVSPVPSEGYGFWNELNRIDGAPADEPLTERDVSAPARARAAERIAEILRFQRKTRFVNKATRNVRRLRYVNALLDEPVFVNVVRDPRPTVASLLRVAFWPDITIWCEGNVTPRVWEATGRDPTELAARLWACDVERSLDDRSELPSGCVTDVRYEELVADPWGVVSRIARSVGLPPAAAFERAVRAFRVGDRNAGSAGGLTAAQVATIGRVAGPTADRIGYTW